VAVAGDLAENRLGMSERVFDALAGEVDAIFHAGALVNLLYPYPQLKPANVGGTREVLRLACRHGATPVHHVSTNGIFPPGRPWWRPQGRPEGRVWGEDADLDALAGSREDGYGLSKWVGEKLVREAARRGLPVCVYRPGNVSGHSVTGASNPRDTLGSVLVESLRLGAAPRIEGWRVEMTPVDFVSAAICHIADGAGSFGRTFHLADPDPVPAENVFAWLEDAGYDLDRLDYPDWTQALREAHREDAYGFAAPESGLRGLAPEPGELWDGNVYDDANVRAALRDGGPQGRPGIDASLIATYAGYFARRGWVAPAEGSKNGRGRRSAVRAGAQRA
jgi:thioester reductase-like protein